MDPIAIPALPHPEQDASACNDRTPATLDPGVLDSLRDAPRRTRYDAASDARRRRAERDAAANVMDPLERRESAAEQKERSQGRPGKALRGAPRNARVDRGRGRRQSRHRRGRGNRNQNRYNNNNGTSNAYEEGSVLSSCSADARAGTEDCGFAGAADPRRPAHKVIAAYAPDRDLSAAPIVPEQWGVTAAFAANGSAARHGTRGRARRSAARGPGARSRKPVVGPEEKRSAHAAARNAGGRGERGERSSTRRQPPHRPPPPRTPPSENSFVRRARALSSSVSSDDGAAAGVAPVPAHGALGRSPTDPSSDLLPEVALGYGADAAPQTRETREEREMREILDAYYGPVSPMPPGSPRPVDGESSPGYRRRLHFHFAGESASHPREHAKGRTGARGDLGEVDDLEDLEDGDDDVDDDRNDRNDRDDRGGDGGGEDGGGGDGGGGDGGGNDHRGGDRDYGYERFGYGYSDDVGSAFSGDPEGEWYVHGGVWPGIQDPHGAGAWMHHGDAPSPEETAADSGGDRVYSGAAPRAWTVAAGRPATAPPARAAIEDVDAVAAALAETEGSRHPPWQPQSSSHDAHRGRPSSARTFAQTHPPGPSRGHHRRDPQHHRHRHHQQHDLFPDAHDRQRNGAAPRNNDHHGYRSGYAERGSGRAAWPIVSDVSRLLESYAPSRPRRSQDFPFHPQISEKSVQILRRSGKRRVPIYKRARQVIASREEHREREELRRKSEVLTFRPTVSAKSTAICESNESRVRPEERYQSAQVDAAFARAKVAAKHDRGEFTHRPTLSPKSARIAEERGVDPLYERLGIVIAEREARKNYLYERSAEELPFHPKVAKGTARIMADSGTTFEMRMSGYGAAREQRQKRLAKQHAPELLSKPVINPRSSKLALKATREGRRKAVAPPVLKISEKNE